METVRIHTREVCTPLPAQRCLQPAYADRVAPEHAPLGLGAQRRSRAGGRRRSRLGASYVPSVIYAFGEFELDDALLELRFRGRAQEVPPRVLKALLHLIRNRARAVSRDELAEAVWGGLSVSDAALSQAIMLARKITHDEGDQQRLIKTVRRHGFRFVAPVVEREPDAGLAPPPAVPEQRASLFGRDRELVELVALLARAEQGQGSLVFLEGEPGIGKTALVEQFCVQASARGARVLWGRCWEEGGAPAFWPFIQVLRAMLAGCGADTLRSWLDGESADLLSLVPELAQNPLARASANALSLGSAQEKFRIFDGMSRVLRRMAHALHREELNGATAGLVVVIALEDLHAADDASLQLLRFLTPDLREAPLLVVGTFRDLEVTPSGPLAALLGGPLENTQRLVLSGLDRRDVARLAERLAGHAVAAPTLQLLHELSGGNPFLVTELARCSEQELERSALSMLRMPERMARAVRRRVDGLPERTRTLLDVAAVLGREFALPLLRAVLGCNDEALLTAMDPALRAGILEPMPGSAGARVRFSHVLVRDATYGELPLAQRVSLHRRIGEALEASHGADQPPLYELAHHFFLAAPEGSASKAREYALRAASHAEQVFAFDSAASLRDRAIELSSSLPAAEGAIYDLLLGAGSAWYRAGELDKACTRFQRAAEHARTRDEGPRLAVAVLSYARVRRGFVVYDEQFLALVRPAIAALGPGDNVLKAMLLGYRSLAINSFGSVTEREASTLDAVEMARRLGHGHALMVALAVRRWLMSGAVHPAQTRSIATELIELARRADRHDHLLEGLFWRIQDHLELGDVELAENDLAEYDALSVSTRHMTHRYWSLLFRAMQRTWCGRFAEAEEIVERAWSLGRRIREPSATVLHAVQLWNIRTLQGATEDAPDVQALSVPDGELYAARAFWLQIRVTQEHLDDARRLYDELARNDFADVPSDPLRRNVLACLSAGCVALDDRARAPKLYELLLPHADINVVATSSWAFVGPVSRLLARLALCMRDYERAALHFERALEQCANFGARPLLARLQYEYAHTLPLIPSAHAGYAAELLAEASRSAQELGIARTWPLPPALDRTDHQNDS